MTPEMTLAQALGQLPHTAQEKLAHSLNQMSVDELEALYRSESGMRKVALSEETMRSYAAKRGTTVEAARAGTEAFGNARRRLKGDGSSMRTNALQESMESDGAGKTVIDAAKWMKNKAKRMSEFRKRNGPAPTPKTPMSGGTKAAIGGSLAAGAIGAGLFAKHRMDKNKKGKKKMASAEPDFFAKGLTFEEKVAMADGWGREVAHSIMEKVAIALPPGMTSALGRTANTVGKGIKPVTTAAPAAAPGVMNNAKAMMGRGLNAITGTGVGMRSAIGAGGGAALGAAKNAIAPERDVNGQPVRGSVLRGALAGAAVGGLAGAGARQGIIAAGSGNGAVGSAIRQATGKNMLARQATTGASNMLTGQANQQMIKNVRATRATTPGTGVGLKPAPTAPAGIPTSSPVPQAAPAAASNAAVGTMAQPENTNIFRRGARWVGDRFSPQAVFG